MNVYVTENPHHWWAWNQRPACWITILCESHTHARQLADSGEDRFNCQSDFKTVHKFFHLEKRCFPHHKELCNRWQEWRAVFLTGGLAEKSPADFQHAARQCVTADGITWRRGSCDYSQVWLTVAAVFRRSRWELLLSVPSNCRNHEVTLDNCWEIAGFGTDLIYLRGSQMSDLLLKRAWGVDSQHTRLSRPVCIRNTNIHAWFTVDLQSLGVLISC